MEAHTYPLGLHLGEESILGGGLAEEQNLPSVWGMKGVRRHCSVAFKAWHPQEFRV